MRSNPPRRAAARVRWSLLAALLVPIVAGCARGGARLEGAKPPGAGYVGGVSMPEARIGAPDRPFIFRATPGHLLFVYFGYTNCPDICPMTMSDLRGALRRIGPGAGRIDVAFVTVDPLRDSAAMLVPYLESFVPGTHALIPRTQEQLGRAETVFGAASSVTKQPDGRIEVSHTGLAYIVDDRGRVLVQWNSGTSARDMAHDLNILLARAGSAS